MIDIAILGLLKDQDLHGYELRKRLDELPGARPTVSFGSLYPALGRLERAGFVKAVTFQTTPAPAAPMSGSLTGELAAFRALRRNAAGETKRGSRGKKVYGLTDRGDRRLQELLVDANVADDSDFEVRMAFCHHLTSTERLALFRHRRSELVRRRDQSRSAGGSRRLTTYLRSFLEHDTEAVTADLAWLDRLIAAEEAAEPTTTTGIDGAEKDRGDN
jgi:DNA-binding PadR family transcriptional regulator